MNHFISLCIGVAFFSVDESLIPVVVNNAVIAAEPADLVALKDVNYKTGSSLTRHLATGSDITWQDNPARRALRRFAEVHGVAIWLDRRVDPQLPISVSIRSASLRGLLDSLTAKLELGWCQIGDVIYIGPPTTAARLPTALAELRKQLAGNNGALPTENLHWPAITSPRDLAMQLARSSSLTITNAEAIPHDLFPEYHLPRLGAAEQLTLLLAGFDLTAEASGNALKIIQLPVGTRTERSYSLGDKDATIVTQLASRFPNSEIQLVGRRVQVNGPAEDHTAIAKLMQPKNVGRVGVPGEKRYTLNVENQPAGGVLQALAKPFGVTVEFDATAQEKIQQVISFDVKDATKDQLLDAVCQPAGLKWTQQESKITVSSQ
jgi:hypothetical protein